MKKNMVYFVMYIVLISELLIVITERDDLQEVENQIRDKMLVTIAKIYKKPIVLNVPEVYSSFNLGAKEPKKLVLMPIGLYSQKEKDAVSFHIDIAPKSPRPDNWPAGGITSEKGTNQYKIVKDNGTAIFVAKFKKAGKYKFDAFCQVDRALPDYLPPRLLKILKEKIGKANLHQKSQSVRFQIDAKRIGGLKKREFEISF